VRSILVVCLAGCYAPVPPEGIACAQNGDCPDPLMCTFGKCVAEPPACLPIAAGTGLLNAPRVDRALVLDGDLADWPTCFVSIDPATAGLVRDLGAHGMFASGRFSLATFANQLYVAAEVQIVPPLGNHPLPSVYLNNAISVYIDGDGRFPDAQYGSDAAQIVVDHANRRQAFRSSALATVPELASASAVGASTFVIEMSVTPASFGLTAFGTPIGFDIGLVGGDGSIMTSELVWFQACKPPACGCTAGEAAPFCDAREFGKVTIAP
jgi:hypothetical protein